MTSKSLAGIVVLSAFSGGLLSWAVHASAEGAPSSQPLTYAGRLEDQSGAPATGPKKIAVELWNASTGGAEQCATEQTVNLVQGRFSIVLDDMCAKAAKANPNLWIEVKADGQTLGRTKLSAVPYALEAAHAVGASTADNAANVKGAVFVTTSGLDGAAYAGCGTNGNNAAACADMAIQRCRALGYEVGWFFGGEHHTATGWPIGCAGKK